MGSSLRLVVTLAIFAATTGDLRSAHAIGLCENTPRHYDPPRLYSEAAQAFAIAGTQEWCEEQQDAGGEVRGKVAFVELRDLTGKVIGLLSSARGPDASRMTDLVGAFEEVTAARLAATLKQRGYLPLQATSPRSRCTVRTTWSAAPKESVNGYPAAKLSLDVLAGAKRIARIDLGLGARDRKGAAAARGQFLPKRSSLAVWASVPTCEGPPPGYFGPDDRGVCYPVDGTRLMVLDATTTPAIAACFAAP